MKPLSHIAEQVNESSTLAMDALYKQMKADGIDVLGFAAGEPDFPTPDRIKLAAIEAIINNETKYTPATGTMALKQAICQRLKADCGVEYQPSQIIASSGAKHCIYLVMQSLVDEGDEVIIPTPAWVIYSEMTKMAGGVPVFIPCGEEEHFKLTPERLEAAITDKSKCIFFNNPSNPTGKVFTREELSTIAALAEKYDAFVITDEVYEHIIFKPYVHTYFCSLPGMWKRTISCSSLSKTYSITGWRLGYLIGPAEVIERAKQVHDFLTVGAAAPLQEAAVTGLRFGPDYYEGLQTLYTEKRNFFVQGLDALGLAHTVPQGSYFIMVDIGKFLALPQFAGYSDLQFCEWVIRNVGVAAVPGSSFFREDVNNFMRLHFARNKDTLATAIDRLAKLNDLVK